MESLVTVPVLADVFVVLLGLVVGSFLNVCIHRLPADRSVVRPRSMCPSCGKTIAWYDNVPVISYILLRARCRSCRAPISLRYPAVEIATALISWMVFWRYGVDWRFPVFFAFSAALLTVSLIDLDHRIIPDEISLSGAVLGLLLALLTPLLPFWDALLGALLGGGFLFVVGMAYEAARKQEGIGGGDIKLLAMIGAFTGWQGALFTIFCGSVVASIVGITLMVARRADGQLPIPFGPFLSFAAFLYVMAGDAVVGWYLSLLR